MPPFALCGPIADGSRSEPDSSRQHVRQMIPVTGGLGGLGGVNDTGAGGIDGSGSGPGGAGTGRLLPTGRPRDVVEGLEASLVDASIPMVFLRARDLGLTGTEMPQAVDADKALCARLEKIRVAASHLMGVKISAATHNIFGNSISVFGNSISVHHNWQRSGIDQVT